MVASNKGVGAPIFQGECFDQAHVLLPDVELHGRGLIDASRHHRPPDLKHPRLARARRENITKRRVVETQAQPEAHGFCGGYIVDGDEQISDEFHLRAGAEGAEVDLLPREAGEDRTAALAQLLVSADVEDQIARRGLGAGAANRGVEHGDSSASKPVRFTMLASERKRAELDHRPIWSPGSCDDAADCLGKRILARKTCQNEFRLFIHGGD